MDKEKRKLVLDDLTIQERLFVEGLVANGIVRLINKSATCLDVSDMKGGDRHDSEKRSKTDRTTRKEKAQYSYRRRENRTERTAGRKRK